MQDIPGLISMCFEFLNPAADDLFVDMVLAPLAGECGGEEYEISKVNDRFDLNIGRVGGQVLRYLKSLNEFESPTNVHGLGQIVHRELVGRVWQFVDENVLAINTDKVANS